MGSMGVTPPPIAILGAGPAGLLFARILENNSIDYTIFERDPDPSYIPALGGTLDIHEDSGQIALKAAGLLDRFKRTARYDAQNVQICDKHGDVKLKFDDEGSEKRPEIDRKDLRRLLQDSVPPGKLQWDSRVQKVERTANGTMSIQCADGSVSSGFRLIVAADGAWSRARSLVTPVKPEYRNTCFFTTLVRPDNPYHSTLASVVGPGNWIAMGDHKMVTCHGLADGSYHFNTGLMLPENWHIEHQELVRDAPKFRKYLLAEHFSDWAPLVKEAIRSSVDDFRAWPQYALPPDSISWDHVPGVALIGDAAHLNVIDGEGVNRALFDGMQLGQQIVQHGLEKLDDAVIEYEREMQPRARKSNPKGLWKMKMFFAEDAPHGLIRAFTG